MILFPCPLADKTSGAAARDARSRGPPTFMLGDVIRIDTYPAHAGA